MYHVTIFIFIGIDIFSTNIVDFFLLIVVMKTEIKVGSSTDAIASELTSWTYTPYVHVYVYGLYMLITQRYIGSNLKGFVWEIIV